MDENLVNAVVNGIVSKEAQQLPFFGMFEFIESTYG